MYLPSSAEEKFLLRKAARLWSVQPDYTDANKELVKVQDRTLIKILEKLSDRVIDGPATLSELILIPRRKKIQRVLAPVYVAKQGEPAVLAAFVPSNVNLLALEFVIHHEDGSKYIEKVTDFKFTRMLQFEGATCQQGCFVLSTPLSAGYYKIELKNNDRTLASSLLMCKPKIAVPMSEKRWGAFAPLYGLRGPRNWGIGDLRDMEEFQNTLHKIGGSFFGTLPLLAAVNEGPHADPSPYSPVSRLFWNEIYLDVQSLTKDHPELWNLTQEKAFMDEVQRLRELSLVDHVGVMGLKKPILMKLAEDFFATHKDEDKDYRSFLTRTPLVRRYAEFRSQGKKNELQYHLYVQFQMDLALKKLHQKAKNNETAGLYLDFPVGASRDGFDGTVFSSSFIQGLSAGAPPDAMFLGGQNWGFAPLHPLHIREEGYQYFIECMRHHMRYADILRLDHVMAFLRIYVIPEGVDAKSGGYVRFHPAEFFALLAIETERFGVKVVGEDLGTVPEAMRQLLDENKSLGMWVLPFEAGETPKKNIAKAKVRALACLNTHDMIPFYGFLAGKDNIIFEDLGVLNSKIAHEWGEGRSQLIKAWMKDFNVKNKEDLLERLLEGMAASPSELLLINIEDLWQEEAPQNVPGTWKEYPNWRRKLKLSTREWAENDNYMKLLGRISQLRAQKKA